MLAITLVVCALVGAWAIGYSGGYQAAIDNSRLIGDVMDGVGNLMDRLDKVRP
jgi:hypothetical protein